MVVFVFVVVVEIVRNGFMMQMRILTGSAHRLAYDVVEIFEMSEFSSLNFLPQLQLQLHTIPAQPFSLLGRPGFSRNCLLTSAQRFDLGLSSLFDSDLKRVRQQILYPHLHQFPGCPLRCACCCWMLPNAEHLPDLLR